MVHEVIERDPTALGGFIYDRRRELGLTMAELAERAGLEASQISKLESGVQRTAHKHTLEKLAKALDSDPRVLRLLSLRPRDPGRLGFPAHEEVMAQWRREKAKVARRSRIPIEDAIQADETIPPDKKAWLLECVQMARTASG
jgi:transcriptional regulator with XRE-family HTH domain